MTEDVRLFVVKRDAYNEMDLATVADVRNNNTWQQ